MCPGADVQEFPVNPADSRYELSSRLVCGAEAAQEYGGALKQLERRNEYPKQHDVHRTVIVISTRIPLRTTLSSGAAFEIQI
jgi:hypothetical protein